MGLEEALVRLGRYGRWQVLNYTILCLVFTFPSSWQLFAIVFIAAVTDHHCTPPANVSLINSSPEEYNLNNELTWSYCNMYVNETSNVTKPCDNGWTFSKSDFAETDGTIVMTWNLVCDDSILVETSQTVFGIGNFIGTIVFTPLADKFGRKRIFFTCLLMMVIFGLSMAFSPNYVAFCIFQFLTGAFSQGLIWTGFIIACELFPTEQRSILAPFGYVFWSIGMALLTLWAHLIRDWSTLQMGISIAGFIGLVFFPWAPESLRWLMTMGKVDQVKAYLASACKMNKVQLPEDILDDDPALKQRDHNVSLLDVYKCPKTRRYASIMQYATFSNGIMYFGLSFLTGVLPGDRYINFLIVALLEAPAAIVGIIVLKVYGRRVPVCVFHIVSALFLGLSSIFSVVTIPGWTFDDMGYLITGLALAGKFGVAGAYVIELIYQQEIYPTPIRATGVGITQGMNVLGSVIAPYSVYLFRILPWVPGVIFAVLSILAAILILWLPETLGRPLPETIEEIASWPLTLSKEDREKLRRISKGDNRVCTENGKEIPTISKDTENHAYSNKAYVTDERKMNGSEPAPSYQEAMNSRDHTNISSENTNL